MPSWDAGLKMQQSFIDFIGCQVVNRFNIHQSGFQLPPIPPQNPPQWLQTSSRGTLLIKVFSRMLIPIVVKLTVHWNRRITTCETPGSFEQFACHKGGWACFRSQPCGWFRNLGWKRESYLPSLSCKCQQNFFSDTHMIRVASPLQNPGPTRAAEKFAVPKLSNVPTQLSTSTWAVMKQCCGIPLYCLFTRDPYDGLYIIYNLYIYIYIRNWVV